MSWSKSIRQVHRWVAIVFTTAVIVDFAALGLGDPPVWIFYLPLPPLFLLMFSGLYMFFLPYVSRWRGGQGAIAEEAR